MNYSCYFCHVNAFRGLLDRFEIAEELRPAMVRDFFAYINSIDPDTTAPEVARNVHQKFKEILGNPDPYKREKILSNQSMMNMADSLRQIIRQSEDPFLTALRLSIGGNIIDYGPSQTFDVEDTLQKVLHKALRIDHSELLRDRISRAKSILYLGDNTGEIVLDQLLLEVIDHPNVTYAVREKPILNDATMEDARLIGMDRLATVITNGDDAPSTLLHRTSEAFNEVFHKADLVISKGMGNLEGLLEVSRADVFFLLIVKCSHIGKLIGAEKGDFVVHGHNLSS